MGFPWLEPEEKTEAIVEAKPAELAPSENVKWLRNAQRSIFEKSARVIEDGLLFRDIDPSKLQEGPPQKWIDELGLPEAERRFRMALAAWAPAKDAPIGFKIAKDAFVGISKALAVDTGAPKTLNMQQVNINLGPPQELPRLRIQRDDK